MLVGKLLHMNSELCQQLISRHGNTISAKIVSTLILYASYKNDQ